MSNCSMQNTTKSNLYLVNHYCDWKLVLLTQDIFCLILYWQIWFSFAKYNSLSDFTSHLQTPHLKGLTVLHSLFSNPCFPQICPFALFGRSFKKKVKHFNAVCASSWVWSFLLVSVAAMTVWRIAGWSHLRAICALLSCDAQQSCRVPNSAIIW